MLRDMRYSLPQRLGQCLPAPDIGSMLRLAMATRTRGDAVTVGYFQSDAAAPDTIESACCAMAERIGAAGLDAYLSVKAPPLGFDQSRIMAIAQAAAASNLTILFDAHAPKDAEPTLALAERLLPEFPGTGMVLPARWQRSIADARRFRDTSARIRVVKGEWPDPQGDRGTDEASYLELVAMLAGRDAPVAVATHRPALAQAALSLLRDAGTPCELEQLRALPRHRTGAVARRIGVPVRVYLPWGPGWWPYAIEQAVARPWLPVWMLRDRIGLADR
ncbi:proline dehydrogenase [Sphingosinithalassobacter portus]|uniref:proline dehydrogenase n=1 Tax=Stakelama portus TaxID=2676234 RepID=UPI000D6E41E6|nr:proline dehydrogenase [Sphingosinithalassobacter portus]